MNITKDELYSIIRECATQILLNEGYSAVKAKTAVNWNYHEIISIVERRTKE